MLDLKNPPKPPSSPDEDERASSEPELNPMNLVMNGESVDIIEFLSSDKFILHVDSLQEARPDLDALEGIRSSLKPWQITGVLQLQ
ncbi:hypothetical protein FALBO_684 [Fusarium albosuccineum]|uniref:Uncharacterized protein n=1 Tax=Fusarium albosuccineum TaxID=1237068 RepID=A0A8H4LQP2_9HYPO|nr:hypothetical protein FALBO_684 [Fusarium albosuccineum]